VFEHPGQIFDHPVLTPVTVWAGVYVAIIRSPVFVVTALGPACVVPLVPVAVFAPSVMREEGNPENAPAPAITFPPPVKLTVRLVIAAEQLGAAHIALSKGVPSPAC
jgi:hypothetical protein